MNEEQLRENPSAMNERIIKEFRLSGGKVGGDFENSLLLLLTVTGRKTGSPITKPLVYLQDGVRWIVFASKAGAPRDPEWYSNLVCNPVVIVELGCEKFEADTTIVTGEERDRLFSCQVAKYPRFGEYQKKTNRTIPVVALSRRS